MPRKLPESARERLCQKSRYDVLRSASAPNRRLQSGKRFYAGGPPPARRPPGSAFLKGTVGFLHAFVRLLSGEGKGAVARRPRQILPEYAALRHQGLRLRPTRCTAVMNCGLVALILAPPDVLSASGVSRRGGLRLGGGGGDI